MKIDTKVIYSSKTDEYYIPGTLLGAEVKLLAVSNTAHVVMVLEE